MGFKNTNKNFEIPTSKYEFVMLPVWRQAKSRQETVQF
jgi:hypothetical protein